MVKSALIIDDIEKWHGVVERNLRYWGINYINHAYNKTQGLEAYIRINPELVITDTNFDASNPGDIKSMSGNLDGLTICKSIRDLSKDTKIIPMSSGQPANLYQEAARLNGADYFLDKKRLREGIDDLIAKLK